MVESSYRVVYKGNVEAPDMGKDVLSAFTSYLDKLNVPVVGSNHPEYDYAFRVGPNLRNVLIGITARSGLISGTERVRMVFSGEESKVRKMKDDLVEIAENLELK